MKRELSSSRWAPRNPTQTAELSRAQRLAQDKEKTERLFKRLLWRAEALWASYNRAMEILHAEGNSHGGQSYAFALGFSSKNAEVQFKVDFFEFHALLERYITLCLSILGVAISAGHANGIGQNVNALRYLINPDLHRTRPLANHQFHANLLDALDSDTCPLRSSLGNQEVMIQLVLAKDYRNCWKDAEEDIPGVAPRMEYSSRKNVRLSDLELNKMLITILAGCQQALGVVQSRDDTAAGAMGPYEGMEMDGPIEYMEDAMDLD